MKDAAYFVKEGVELLLDDAPLSPEECERLSTRFGSFDNAINEIVAYSEFVDTRFDQLIDQHNVPLSLTRPMLASEFGYGCVKSVAKTGFFDAESVVQTILSATEALERECKANHKILMPAMF